MGLNLFGKHGEYVRPPEDQLAGLSPASHERFMKVDAMAQQLAAKEAELKVGLELIADGVKELDRCEKAFAKFPKMNFHDLWRLSTSRLDKSLAPVPTNEGTGQGVGANSRRREDVGMDR